MPPKKKHKRKPKSPDEKIAEIRLRSLTGNMTGAPPTHWERADIQEIQTRHYAVELGAGQGWRENDSFFALADLETGEVLRRWQKKWVRRVVMKDGRVEELERGA